MVLIWGIYDLMSNHTKVKTENQPTLTDCVPKLNFVLSALWLITSQRQPT